MSPRVGQSQDKFQEKEEETPDHQYKGAKPIAGRSIASVFLTDVFNLVYAPGS